MTDNARALMLAHLKPRGLNAADAKHLGLEALEPERSRKLTGINRPGIYIPYNGTNYWRVRHVGDRTGFDALTKERRYSGPKGAPPRLYLPSIAPWTETRADISIDIYATEGEFKSACGCKHDLPTIGIGGVDNFMSRRHGIQFLPDFDQFTFAGRRFYLVPDGPDVDTNENVHRATYRLAGRLIQRGAEVFLIALPANGDTKAGLDDYLVEQGRKEFDKLQRKAKRITAAECLRHLGFPETDAGNAEALAFLHGDDVRYVHGVKTWMMWTGGRWEPDKASGILLKAKATARARATAAVDIPDEDRRKRALAHALKSENRYQQDAMIDRARAEPPVATEINHWDANPLLFGAANGVVDLETGNLITNSRSHLISKHSPVSFDPKAKCPRWEKFLRDVVLDERGKPDEEVITHFHRTSGYALTGLTREHYLWLLEGAGRNGKSTLVETLAYILSDYAVTLNFESIATAPRAADGGKGATPEIAGLRGARLAYVSEIRQGQQLNEGLVKKLTGGDKIKARGLHQDPIEFFPTHKLLLHGNHLPKIDDTTDSIWARILRIKFRAAFGSKDEVPAAEFRRDKDPTLGATLRTEAPGILAWVVRGCLDWQRHGLAIPATVRTATEEYRSNEDRLTEFLDTCTIRGDAHKAKATDLYAAYQRWAVNLTVPTRYMMSQRTLYDRLHQKFKTTRPKNALTFHGVRVNDYYSSRRAKV